MGTTLGYIRCIPSLEPAKPGAEALPREPGAGAEGLTAANTDSAVAVRFAKGQNVGVVGGLGSAGSAQVGWAAQAVRVAQQVSELRTAAGTA